MRKASFVRYVEQRGDTENEFSTLGSGVYIVRGRMVVIP